MEYLTFFVWVFFVWICIYVLFTYGTRKRKLPPGPLPLPIVGNLFKLGNRPHESLTELAKTYGPLMTMKLGCVTTVVVSSASMAKEILHINDRTCSNRTIPDALRALNHHKTAIAFLPVSPTWRNLRKICTIHMFTARKLDESQDLRGQKVQELLAYIGENCLSGCAVNIGQAAFVTTLNMMSNTLFSIDFACYKSESSQEFKDLVWRVMEEIGRPNLADYFPMLRPFDPQSIKRRMEIYLGKLYELFEVIIDQRLKSRELLNSSKYSDFLDVLLDHDKEVNDSELGRTQIQDLLLDLFLAGTETTSNTVEWAMAELLHNPNTMKKARLELKETIDENKPIDESDIARLHYLQAIVKETMRLHPAAPLLLPHKAETEVEICGFTVPRQAQVIVNAWAIGRDPSSWVDPNLFVPERFLGSNIDFRGRDFELIPFGAGRRMCPGLPLAFRTVHLLLASFLHLFDWKLQDGMTLEDMDMKDKFGITLQKAEPLLAIPVHV